MLQGLFSFFLAGVFFWAEPPLFANIVCQNLPNGNSFGSFPISMPPKIVSLSGVIAAALCRHLVQQLRHRFACRILCRLLEFCSFSATGYQRWAWRREVCICVHTRFFTQHCFYDDGHCFLPADDGGDEEDCYHSSLLSWNDPDLS